jgi:hypothetical protein
LLKSTAIAELGAFSQLLSLIEYSRVAGEFDAYVMETARDPLQEPKRIGERRRAWLRWKEIRSGYKRSAYITELRYIASGKPAEVISYY